MNTIANNAKGQSLIRKGNIKEVIAKYSIYFITLVMVIISAVLNDRFLTGSNIMNVLRQSSIFAMAAFAEAILIISGNLDLSLGSTMALSGCVCIGSYVATGSIVVAMLVAMLVGLLCNLLNGVVIVRLKLPPFIATLSTQMAFRGAVYLYTDGVTLTQTGEGFERLGQGYVGPVPIPVIIMFIAGLVMYVLLDKTRLGRNLFAMGGNPEAARASGINLKSHTIISYLIAGLYTGLAGVMLASRLNAGLPNSAVGYEGQGIAAAVIGGVGFAGGTGSAWGAIIGAFIMGIFSNILNLMGVNSYIQEIVTGAIIIAAVALDTFTRSQKVSR